MRKKVVVVGAGLGGLALAARLQHTGNDVVVVEKNSFPGGRCGTIDAEGFHFDTGPTLLLMPDVLRRFFTDLGANIDDYLDLRRIHPNYRMHFRDGSSFEFTSDRERMGETLEAIEPGGAKAFARFMDEAGYCYRVARENFVERNFVTAGQFFTASNLGMLFRMRAHRRMYSLIGGYFRDERLRQAFSFQTMYLGLSPFKSPALYTLLPFAEFDEGIWYPMGGMHELAKAMVRLLEENGGSIRLSSPVRRVETTGRRTTGVTLESGEFLAADVVVTNADLPYARDTLMSTAVRKRKWRFTSSGFLIHLGLSKRYDNVPHHSVIFSRDYARNFREIFDSKVVPDDPAFYICRPTATDPTVAPPGQDVLYLLAPMPHLEGDINWDTAARQLRKHIFARMAELGFDDLESSIVVERTWTPVDFKNVLNLASGCAFGLSHDMLQVGYLRPHNRDADHDNHYYVGASTHPGTGIPMVLFSAELVEKRIREEWQ